MNITDLIININQAISLPAALLFIATALFLTLKNRFIQIRGIKHLIKIVKSNIKTEKDDSKTKFSPFHALFTAMATTIGIGNVVGPALGIVTGGPGSLFWLIAYAFFSSATKYTEVVLAITNRERTSHGYILGGPMQYIRLISVKLAKFYAFLAAILFAGWSAGQSNTMAKILASEGFHDWTIGLILSILVLIVLWGGIQRVGSIASKLVPAMFVFYVTFALYILLKDFGALSEAIILVFKSAFTPAAAVGGFLGATVFDAMKSGTFRSIYITEAGIGTSSIPHSLANVEKAQTQGILALYSMAADAFLCLISGLMVIVTGSWLNGKFTPTLVYEMFKAQSPVYGKYVLLISITLFVLTTVIGNSFNGSQIFGWLTKHRYLKLYYVFVAFVIFLGSIAEVPVVWAFMDTLLTFVAIPNLICLMILSIRNYKDIKI